MSDAEEPLGSPDDDASALVAMLDFAGGPSCVAPPECKAVMVRWGSVVRYTCVEPIFDLSLIFGRL